MFLVDARILRLTSFGFVAKGGRRINRNSSTVQTSFQLEMTGKRFLPISFFDRFQLLLTCQSANVYDPEFHRKLWFGSSNVRGKRCLS